MTDKTPDRVLATTGLYPRFVGDWSEGEWLPVHPEEQVACYRVEYVRADLHAAVVAERDQLKGTMKSAFEEGFTMAASLTPHVHETLRNKDAAWKTSKSRKALEKRHG